MITFSANPKGTTKSFKRSISQLTSSELENLAQYYLDQADRKISENESLEKYAKEQRRKENNSQFYGDRSILNQDEADNNYTGFVALKSSENAPESSIESQLDDLEIELVKVFEGVFSYINHKTGQNCVDLLTRSKHDESARNEFIVLNSTYSDFTNLPLNDIIPNLDAMQIVNKYINERNRDFQFNFYGYYSIFLLDK